MKKYLLSLVLFTIAVPVMAANTSGYAWSESVGWFDFSNATIGDTTVTGYAYNDNTGWLVLDGITNSGGTLSGYAWSESVGYFDFTDVAITSGSFSGYAYNDNTGWLSFEDGTNVTTTWTSASAQSSGDRKPSHRRVITQNPTGTPSTNTPSNTPNNSDNPNNNSGEAGNGNIANNPRDLEYGATGIDVKLLQQFLNSRGFIVNPNPGGPGSIGFETQFFGPATRAALIKFQQANGITPSLGYFGPKTRAFIITLLNNN